ncbi:MAG: hypothetical protein JF888_09130 [Candidatus Dormibacteraeota bacterium]|uniref:Potassium channel domain-containing protein n=1 Tax=Candidatus Dormiibacter inghamiae TaxID=3127013 RepID=A0A934KGW1_9BACT|nr:hypothetical protein [Candidatus Dormibacteraeota bacterium]MBJ7606534.1 hypothetical protein [Candidatus Dormibacteraeota bacterium]
MIYLQLAGRVLLFLAGLAIVAATLGSSVRTVILPRASVSFISRAVFLVVRQFCEIRIGRRASYERRDAILASYGPVTLLLLLATWITLIVIVFQIMFWAVGNGPFVSLQASGSSVLTLGFSAPHDLPNTLQVLVEGLIGLVQLALLISYLPTIYAAFQRREAFVSKLDIRADSPPPAWRCSSAFSACTVWSVSPPRSGNSGGMVHRRGGEPHLAACPRLLPLSTSRQLLDHRGRRRAGRGRPLRSTLDGRHQHDSHADRCLRAGYLALRAICGYFQIPLNAAPQRGDPISITRSEFDSACERLQASGLPVRGDREASWEDFSGWRVNYDEPLLILAGLISALYAPWSSDRGNLRRPSLFRGLLR